MNLTVEVDISQSLKGMDPAELDRRLTVAMHRSVARAEQEVKNRMPVDLGAAKASVYGRVRGSFGGASLTGTVSSSMEYIAALETGTGVQGPEHRKRKPPPASALEPWVRRNWRISQASGKKRKLKGSELKKAVRRLQWHIAIHGTPPHWMFRDGLKASVPYIESAFKKAVQGWG